MKTPWKRHRFHANYPDYRPIKFPPPGPYWCSGTGEGYSIIVAYLPSAVEVTEFWPEASQIDSTDEAAIVYSSRFAKPDWWKGE